METLRRGVRRWLRRRPRWFRRLAAALWRSAGGPARPVVDPLQPSPGVAAFLDGETMRQVAYYVGTADPGIIDPRLDWPGAVADAHGVVRAYAHRLRARVAELEQQGADDDHA